jgi:hypothetical protein
MHDGAHFMALAWREECMNVIGHNAPRVERVTSTVEMEQRILDHFGEFSVPQGAGPISAVEKLMNSFPPLVILIRAVTTGAGCN